MDYLVDEVLALLPVAIRDFLSRPPSGPPVWPGYKAVVGVDDPVCNDVYLEWLEHANLFTIADDQWYRYHHCFSVFADGTWKRAGQIAAWHRRFRAFGNRARRKSSACGPWDERLQ